MDGDTHHLTTMSHPRYPNIVGIRKSIEGTEKLLNNINIHIASGLDKIPNIIPKTCSKEIFQALAHIFQQSHDTLPKMQFSLCKLNETSMSSNET